MKYHKIFNLKMLTMTYFINLISLLTKEVLIFTLIIIKKVDISKYC